MQRQLKGNNFGINGIQHHPLAIPGYSLLLGPLALKHGKSAAPPLIPHLWYTSSGTPTASSCPQNLNLRTMNRYFSVTHMVHCATWCNMYIPMDRCKLYTFPMVASLLFGRISWTSWIWVSDRRCRPRWCRRSPPDLLSFVWCPTRSSPSCNCCHGSQAATHMSLKQFEAHRNAKGFLIFLASPSHLILIWHNLHLKSHRNVWCNHPTWSTVCSDSSRAWTCCSNLKHYQISVDGRPDHTICPIVSHFFSFNYPF